MSATDRVWRFVPHENAYRLEASRRAVTAPSGLNVQVRVKAVSLNYRDLIHRDNAAGRSVAGVVPCSDGAGEVLAVGPDVTAWKPGDRVAACFFPTWAAGRFPMSAHQAALGGSWDGMLAETVTLPETAWVRIPAHLSHSEAATLPCAAVTAYSALVTRGQLQPESTVLVLGTGGVSIFGLQIATALGARVIVTSRSDEKLARATQLGAWKTVNYRTNPDWDREVWKLTEKQGVDHILEVGGPGTLEKSMQCIAAGGQLALIGVLTGFGAPSASLFPLVARNVRLDGIYVGSRTDFAHLNALLDRTGLRPVIDREFAFEQAPEAFDYLASGAHFGKVTIRID